MNALTFMISFHNKMRRSFAITASLLVILEVSYGVQQETEKKIGEQECPTWFVPQSNQTGGCKCGVQTFLSLVAVKCNEDSNQTMLHSGFCMTYNESTDVTVVGGCPYNSHKIDYQQLYVNLPQNVSHLNEFMCGGMNRTGPLCSHCQEGLGIPMFSYTLHCLHCLNRLSGWLLYIFLVVFPTTIFFLIVIFFQIRVTSAPMNAFILFCQCYSNVVNSQSYTILTVSPFVCIITIVLSTFYGFWNLDFFRYIIPSFCVSDQLTPNQVISLEYVVAFYPLLLIVTTYICVELHAKDCRLIVWLWRPFRRFSSFLLLSYSKILFVSFQLLSASKLYNPNGQMVGPTVRTYYDASIEYFSAPHLPFALLAICVLCVFVVTSALVLLLYPTRAFQMSLGCCRVRLHALHAFADTFNGYYKNGTEGTRDYRYFAGLYVTLNIAILSSTLGFFIQYYWMLLITCCAVTSLLFAVLRPYKNNWINVWDSVVFALIAFVFLWIMYIKYIGSLPFEVVGIIATIPLMYIIVYIMYKHTNTVRNCCVLLSKCRTNPQLEPHRLHNPEEYRQPLLNADCPENEHSNSATPAGLG